MTNAPNGLPNSHVLLRDQFVEHVCDCSLRRELKQLVRRHPNAILLEVRGEAIRWEREGMPGGVRERSHSVPSATSFQFAMAGGPHSGSGNQDSRAELAELKDMLKQQQEQLNQLSGSLIALQNVPRQSFHQKKQPIICRRCRKPRHFARECDGERVYAPPQPSSRTTPMIRGDRPPHQNQQLGNFHPLNR